MKRETHVLHTKSGETPDWFGGYGSLKEKCLLRVHEFKHLVAGWWLCLRGVTEHLWLGALVGVVYLRSGCWNCIASLCIPFARCSLCVFWDVTSQLPSLASCFCASPDIMNFPSRTISQNWHFLTQGYQERKHEVGGGRNIVGHEKVQPLGKSEGWVRLMMFVVCIWNSQEQSPRLMFGHQLYFKADWRKSTGNMMGNGHTVCFHSGECLLISLAGIYSPL